LWKEVSTVKKYFVIALVLGLTIAVAGFVAVSHAASATSNPAPETAATVDTDNIQVQSGDQTTPDAATAKEAGETQSEAAGESTTEEPGDQNLPGGGHQDAPGANVDNQFEGVQ
jgi:hypothetical protein